MSGTPPPGFEALSTPDVAGLSGSALIARLALDETGRRAVEALFRDGARFLIHSDRGAAGLIRFQGWTEGRCAHVWVVPADAGERALHDRLRSAEARAAAADAAQRRAEHGPVPAFEIDGEGRLIWHNRASASMARLAGGPAKLPALVAAGDGVTLLRTADGTRVGWGRVSTVPTETGQLVFIEDIDSQVHSQEALDSFTETLTQTFAHIDSALAIFDRSHRLSLFNPALSDLFGLDPAALARQPSLREFLEALRQRRMVPEQTDFASWRRRLASAVSAESADPYQEDWSLPSGKIIRVTARPHPRGAVAYVFRDISGYVLLERRYRAEIELGHAALDRLDIGIAVFGSAGDVVYANRMFEDTIGISAATQIDGLGIDAVVSAAIARSEATDTWQAFKEYALAGDRTEAWDQVAHQSDGPSITLQGRALPDGSTMLAMFEGAGPWGLSVEPPVSAPDDMTGARVSRTG